MIYYVYRSLSKQKTGKGKISFATFQHFNIFASGSGPFLNYYMVPFLVIIYTFILHDFKYISLGQSSFSGLFVQLGNFIGVERITIAFN